jgi:hypothetical protein
MEAAGWLLITKEHHTQELPADICLSANYQRRFDLIFYCFARPALIQSGGPFSVVQMCQKAGTHKL